MTATGGVEDRITAAITLTIQGERFDAQVTVPSGTTTCSRLLPVFRALAEAIVGVGVEQCGNEGKTVSCSRGCGACCRQLVPISGTEAREIRALIRDLPEPRRTEVEGRFRDAGQRLETAGLSEHLLADRPFAPGESERLGLEYFRLAVAARVSTALSRLDRRPGETGRAWVPLILAPEWAERNPEEAPRPGPELLSGLIGLLTGDRF